MKRLLIANRGEIAVRIARGAREMGISPVGVYSEADSNAYFLRFMDDAVCIGPPPATESYLRGDAVIAAAATLRADAIHPGYGFLSERAPFAQAVLDAGLIFVGPPPSAMAAMGSKIEAKHRAREADVPTIPGYDGAEQTLAALRTAAKDVGFPLLIKASAGGGGRGMRVVSRIEEFDDALAAAKREALASFGDDAVLLERYLVDPRHIEFQILADAHGNIVHLGERECSIQRRHQKVVEEAPSSVMTPELRLRMGAAAVRAAKSVGYVNAGTAEFMLDTDGAFYFLEMNARLQVEHPVTELVYGVDLVDLQLRIADGEKLPFTQEQIAPRGWAIETRINAEDPARDMLPSIGEIHEWHAPEGPGIRVDSGVTTGSEIGVYYDSMLAKLIVFGSDRAHAVTRLQNALADFEIVGITSNLPLLRAIAASPAFAAGETTTSFLGRYIDDTQFANATLPSAVTALACAALLAANVAPWRIASVGLPLHLRSDEEQLICTADRADDGEWLLSGAVHGALRIVHTDAPFTIEFAGERVTGRVAFADDGTLHIGYNGASYTLSYLPPPSSQADGLAGGSGGGHGRLTAPMPGKIVKITVREGDALEARALVLVLEAMKMEHRIETPLAGTLTKLFVREGDLVTGGATLAEICEVS